MDTRHSAPKVSVMMIRLGAALSLALTAGEWTTRGREIAAALDGDYSAHARCGGIGRSTDSTRRPRKELQRTRRTSERHFWRRRGGRGGPGQLAAQSTPR